MVTSFQPGNVAHLAVLELPEIVTREHFREYMDKCGIQTDIHYPILDSQQIGLAATKYEYSLPNSISAVGRIVSVPLFPELSANEINQICSALRNFAN